MKATVTASGLASAASWIARIVPARPSVPVLGGVLIQATEDGVLSLAAFDFETSGIAHLGDDTLAVDEPGRALVSGRLLAALAKTLGKGDQAVEIGTDDAGVTVRVGSSRWAMPAMPIDDYPTLPAVASPVGEVLAGLLTRAVDRAAPAAGTDASLPMLTGLMVELDPAARELTAVGTDRFRMSIDAVRWDPAEGAEQAAMLCPSTLLRFAASAFDRYDGPVTVHRDGQGDGAVGFSTPARTVTGRLLGLEFPRWRNLDMSTPGRSTRPAASAVLAVAGVKEAVARASVMDIEGAHLLFNCSEDGLEVSLTSDHGATEHAAPVAKFAGEAQQVRLNQAFLKAALDGCDSDLVQIDFTGGYKPLMLRPLTAEHTPMGSYRHMLMPMKLPGSS